VAVDELDGDRRLDLAVADDGSDDVSVLLGDGSGGLGAATSLAAGSEPFSVAAARGHPTAAACSPPTACAACRRSQRTHVGGATASPPATAASA
jgi:hypothetical protein